MKTVLLGHYLTATLLVVLLPQVIAPRPAVEISVIYNTTSSISIQVNGEEVEEVGVVGWGGIHVAALHSVTGTLLASRSLPTANPSEARVLANFLAALQPGRILVLIMLAGGGLYLSPADDILRHLGFRVLVGAVGVGEVWVGVTDGVVTHEVVVPAPPPSSYALLTQPRRDRTVALTQVFLSRPGMRCSWHSRPEMRAQREFCDTHEGFPELCRCRDPMTPALARASALRVDLQESIPVVVATSRHPYHLYRTLLQLLQMPGGGQTSFLVALEGESAATKDLTALFGIPCSQIHARRHHHHDQSDNHDNNNSSHEEHPLHLQAATQVIAEVTRHALTFAFDTFPEAKKVIFLEDDVLPSPDFLWFFQQTAVLLDKDPTVLAVTAHHTFSVAGRGLDPTRLLRGAMPPQWGWMADRRLLEAWVPENWGDWDYWVLAWARSKGLDVVFPEVSRSLHAGSGGTHIDGFHQAIAFDHQAALLPALYMPTPVTPSYSSPSPHPTSYTPISSRRKGPHTPSRISFTATSTSSQSVPPTPPVLINLTDVSSVVKEVYSARLRGDLVRATPITMHTLDRCGPALIPQKQEGPFVMFFGDPREHSAVMKCLGLYAEDPRCDFEHVQQLSLDGHRVFLVDCPASPHCVHRPPDYLAVPHDDLLMEAVAALDLFRRNYELRTPFRVRRASRSSLEETTLGNLATGYAILGIDLASFFLNKVVVLPRSVKEKKDDNEHDDLVESKGLSEDGGVKGVHLKGTSHPKQVESPLAGPQNSQQQGGAVAGVGVGGRGAVPSLLKPYSERRVRARRRGRATAQAMRGESDDEAIEAGHYTSCLVVPCLVSDPLLHPRLLPPHLQAAARLVLREAEATQHHSAYEFTVPDYFRDAKLFSAFYRYY